ncbi:JmjC domain-containing protein [Actinomadura macra]|uniref:JmjC domain-containing protein n=1 Tax=Actinomadura macra TaxID=46164 RepID=UPI000834D33D|nr:cupin domain-containing protein [Actinomadura macra]
MSWSDIFADPADRERVDWGRTHLRFTASPTTTSLLSFQRIDDWIRYGQVRYPQFQVNLLEGGVPPTLFTETRQYLALSMPGYPVTAAIAEQIRQGATLRFVKIEDWYRPVAELADRLTATIGGGISTYAFYTAPGDDGVGAHWDAADVFVLQVEGTKKWNLWNIQDGVGWQASQSLHTDRDPDHVIELAPGDGLYIPAGTGHRAFAGPRGSLHLSIALSTTSHRKIIRTLLEDLLAAVPLLDRLPVDGDRLTPVAALLRDVAEAAGKTDPAALLAKADRHEPRISESPLIAGVEPARHDP